MRYCDKTFAVALYRRKTLRERRIVNRYVLLPLLLVVVYLPAGRGPASARSSIRVSATLHGIRLTLVVPGRTFPRNALIWVDVRLTNLTRTNVPIPQLSDTGWPCSPNTVEVFDDHNIVLYPPAVRVKRGEPLPLNPPCPAPDPSSKQLHPGESASGSDLVILRAPSIHATVQEGHDRITTPTVRFNLKRSRSLHVSLVRNSGGIRATVPSVNGTRRQVFVNSLWQCNQGGLIRVSSGGWSEQAGSAIHAGCAAPAIWYATVGYLNRPIGVVDYVRGRRF
jgi:hypothetical protein